MPKISVIIISSVRPAPSSGGELILHRHFVGQPAIDCIYHGDEPKNHSLRSLARKLLGRIGRTRWTRWTNDVWVIWNGRWLDPLLPGSNSLGYPRTVVVTVAHGDACFAAMRFAKKNRLQLVTFFHDWWPDMPEIHPFLRPRLEQDFRDLYKASSVAFCVSTGMRETLGPHPGSEVLYPIPEDRADNCSPNETLQISSGRPFRLLYAGNLADYGEMLGTLLTALGGHTTLRLEVRGQNPPWSEEIQAEMRTNGLWVPFVERDALDSWLSTGDAFLVTQNFDLKQRRRMETNFPSKLPEYSRFGKPIIIWGPEYGSAAKWARQEGSALCVTNPNPMALVHALDKLAATPQLLKILAIRACRSARSEFNPGRIQSFLIQKLNDACTIV